VLFSPVRLNFFTKGVAHISFAKILLVLVILPPPASNIKSKEQFSERKHKETMGRHVDSLLDDLGITSFSTILAIFLTNFLIEEFPYHF
jgi:hypothetical protein